MNNQPTTEDLKRVLTEHWQEEIRKMGRRASQGMMHKAKNGHFPGKAPLGYKNARIGKENAIVIDRKTAPTVKGLFALAVAKKTSPTKLAAAAVKMGLTSRNGRPLGPPAIRAILSNPFYIGRFRYRGRSFDGRHSALIEERHFEAVQMNLVQK